jgi:hypothetical protein
MTVQWLRCVCIGIASRYLATTVSHGKVKAGAGVDVPPATLAKPDLKGGVYPF